VSLTNCLEKITKSLFKQDSYQIELSDKIKAVRQASFRFAELAQLCSYREIANTRLDIREHQRLSRAAYEQLFEKFEGIQESSAIQNQVFGSVSNRILTENEATQKMINVMAYRVMTLEAAFYRFADAQHSMQSVHPLRIKPRKQSNP
jgi:hypothetical protein